MFSVLQIWNAALSHIQHKSQVRDPEERSVEASYCKTFYPMALAVTLERYDWNFARRHETLATVTNLRDDWMFAYARPSNCVAVRAVLLPTYGSDKCPQPFEEEGGNIYTNFESAICKLTRFVEDTSKFTPHFGMALSYDLAALLAGPIPRDARTKQNMLSAAAGYAAMAAAIDANAGHSSSYNDFTPNNIQARNT